MSKEAEAAKARGNAAFKAKNYLEAVANFSKAIELDPEEITYYSNRSAAYLKNTEFAEALTDAEKCVELDVKWAKGYARKGAALFALKKYAEAVACYATGISMDPESETLLEGLTTSQKALASNPDKKKKKKRNKKKNGKKTEDADDKEGPPPGGYVIGIDLGTTYSCVGVWKGDGVVILENNDGQKTIPSYVCFDPASGERYTGHAAKNQSTRFPTNTLYDVKRIIGQRYTDMGVEQDISKMQYTVLKGDDDKPMVQVVIKGEKKLFAPEEVSAMVLSYCKELAEKQLGCAVTRAVVTVPAYFNDSQRNATKAAGKIAGLDVLRIINEPTAAALSYGLDNEVKDGKPLNVLIQGAILNGKRNSKTDSLLLMDVTPLSLGIETTGRVMSVVIPRNTAIPCVKTQTYTTEANYQTKVDVSVYEGERLKSDENNLLGEFTISGIESAKRGEPQIDVSFSIDSNGILNVTARDQKTRASAKIEIANRSRATTDEIDKMVAEAAKFKEEDKERMRKIEAKNELEQAIYECMNAAKETEDGKIANILTEAADKEQVWLDQNYDDVKAADIAMHRRALSRRLEGRAR
jgi:molecular chaperone DnaK (HSP70)